VRRTDGRASARRRCGARFNDRRRRRPVRPVEQPARAADCVRAVVAV